MVLSVARALLGGDFWCCFDVASIEPSIVPSIFCLRRWYVALGLFAYRHPEEEGEFGQVGSATRREPE